MVNHKKGSLLNSLDHPVYIAYMGETLVISPRQKVDNVEREKLGAIPKGVVYIPSGK